LDGKWHRQRCCRPYYFVINADMEGILTWL
jgi:hypothetical protein